MKRATKINRYCKWATTFFLSALLLVGPAQAARDNQRNASVDAADSGQVLTEPLPRIPGPKRTVAVAPFGTKSDFLAQYGLTDVGGGLAAMLTTALIESGQVIVIERNRLSSLLNEQALQASGVVKAEGGPGIGRLVGAQLMIAGEVTEFSLAAKGKGFSFGLGSSGKRLGLSPKAQTGTVAMDIRVIDTTSGEVVAAYAVHESIKSKALAVNVGLDQYSAGYTRFMKTPLGQAARVAITRAAQRFAEEMAAHTWTGNVVDFDRGDVSINAGAEAGIRIGDTLRVYRISKVLTDPATGRVLGQRKRAIGNVVIDGVEENLAFGQFQPLVNLAPRRGDLVLER